MSLTIKNLTVQANKKTILQNIQMTIAPGEIHALLGSNGSGKSSLAYAILGHPEYSIIKGDVQIKKSSILKMRPEERAKAGLFLSFQEPPEVGGVEMGLFLKKIISRQEKNKKERFLRIESIKKTSADLHTAKDFLSRFLNKDFSGGEKKKSELLQLLAIVPKFAILDEIDSGLDLDSTKEAIHIIQNLSQKKKTGFIIISHHVKLLKELPIKKIYILHDGKIIKTGDKKLLKTIEKEGFHCTNIKTSVKKQRESI